MATNGRMTESQLTPVQGDIELSITTAAAWKALVAAARKQNRAISIAPPAGGYRSVSVQATMKQVAEHGTVAEKRAWGLSTSSTATLATPGTSNHGLGVCVDIIGTPLDAAFLKLAGQYGFTRPLAATDPNHFEYDGHTIVAASPARVHDRKKLAAYFESRNKGSKTATTQSGKVEKGYVRLVQLTGHQDRLYPVPPYRVDDVWGPRTHQLEDHYADKIGAWK